MGLFGFCLTPMLSQITIDYLATKSFALRPLTWLKLISQHGGTISFSPTFGYDLCATRGLNGSAKTIDLSRWRVAGIGGERVRRSAERRGGRECVSTCRVRGWPEHQKKNSVDTIMALEYRVISRSC